MNIIHAKIYNDLYQKTDFNISIFAITHMYVLICVVSVMGWVVGFSSMALLKKFKSLGHALGEKDTHKL